MRAMTHSDGLTRVPKGAVLFVSMIILLLLSLTAVLAGSMAIMQNKMAASTRSTQLATLAAESAMNEARSRIATISAEVGAGRVCTRIACVVQDGRLPIDAAELLSSDAARSAQIAFRYDLTKLHGSDESMRLAQMPIYVIEDLGTTSGQHLFRILARGIGATSIVSHVVESVYAVAEPAAT
jgi:type IV pilus assembly protein PilX